jgi:hypothetical protein
MRLKALIFTIIFFTISCGRNEFIASPSNPNRISINNKNQTQYAQYMNKNYSKATLDCKIWLVSSEFKNFNLEYIYDPSATLENTAPDDEISIDIMSRSYVGQNFVLTVDKENSKYHVKIMLIELEINQALLVANKVTQIRDTQLAHADESRREELIIEKSSHASLNTALDDYINHFYHNEKSFSAYAATRCEMNLK